MKIKVSNRKCHTTAHKRTCQKLAHHVVSHYPKDRVLHKAVRSVFQSMDQAASKLEKAKSRPKRRARKAPKRMRRTRVARRMKRTAPKRRRAMKRTAPKRRRTMKRTARRAA